MSDALEPWKRKCIKKGRLRSKLLSFGPATIDALLTIARLDDPNATEESLVEILLASMKSVPSIAGLITGSLRSEISLVNEGS